MTPDGENHYGKAMLSMDGERAKITIECNECGRIEHIIEPIHLRTMAQLCNKMADELGVDDHFTSKIVSDHMSRPHTLEELREVEKDFEKMPMRPQDAGGVSKFVRSDRKSLWGGE